MARTSVSFAPIFVVFAFVVVYFGWAQDFLIYIIVLLLHEYAHAFVAKCYGYKLNKIVFMPYGASLSGENNIIKPMHEIVIAMAGPALNFFLVLICYAMWWWVPESFAYTQTFVVSNLVLATFNLLPIFPLDGGRIVVAFLGEKFGKLKLYKVMKVVGICSSVLFLLMFVTSAFYSLNLTFAFISFFLLMSSFNSVKDVYFERSFAQNFAKQKSVSKPWRVKTFVVSQKTPVHKLAKYIYGNSFVEFLVLDENMKVVATITETDVKNALMKTQKR